MHRDLSTLLEEIHELERTVAAKIKQTKSTFTFEIQHGRTIFSPEVQMQHRVMMKRAWRTIIESTLLTIVTAPVIYALIVPISMLDLFVTVYQWVCFPVYKIPAIRRNEYVVIDRHSLAYLNVIEKVNCVYCGYCNGVIAYAREIASRTEQYWCPIKHAKIPKSCHSRQCLFCEFGDAEGYRRDFASLRKSFDDCIPRDVT